VDARICRKERIRVHLFLIRPTGAGSSSFISGAPSTMKRGVGHSRQFKTGQGCGAETSQAHLEEIWPSAENRH
jgi:hypothetical protein